MFWERRDKEVNNWDICNLLTDDQPSSSSHSLVLYGIRIGGLHAREESVIGACVRIRD